MFENVQVTNFTGSLLEIANLAVLARVQSDVVNENHDGSVSGDIGVKEANPGL